MAPLYVPNPDSPAVDDLIEALGAALANRYATAEDELIREIAKRAYRDVALQAALQNLTLTAERTMAFRDRIAQNRGLADLAGYRARTIRELQFLAVETTERLRLAGTAQQLIDIATREGEAAAAARLKMAANLPAVNTLTGTATQATASLVLSLESRLEAMHLRITRYPQDAYQRVISMTAPNVLLGIQTNRVAQAQAVQQFLSEGITGFVDKANRNWRIGTYAEMAGRTAVARAYETAGVWRMQQSGLNVGTIVGSIDACAKCAPWIGMNVSLDGSPAGPREMPHSTKDQTVVVQVKGTLEQARAAGYGHPNDRCRVVALLPGLTVPQKPVEYDREREKERENQRELEREIRSLKRKQSVAGDDLTRRKLDGQIKDAQADMREFIRDTGRHRRSDREQLHFTDGR